MISLVLKHRPDGFWDIVAKSTENDQPPAVSTNHYSSFGECFRIAQGFAQAQKTMEIEIEVDEEE